MNGRLRATGLWPFSSLATLVVVGISISIVLWLLSALFSVRFPGIGENLLAALLAVCASSCTRRSIEATGR